MPLSSSEFRENRCSESRTVLKGLNEMLSYFLQYSSDLGKFGRMLKKLY